MLGKDLKPALFYDLKPCPFCGGIAHMIKDTKTKKNLTEYLEEPDITNIYWVKCIVCQVSSWSFDSQEKAWKHWNKRC